MANSTAHAALREAAARRLSALPLGPATRLALARFIDAEPALAATAPQVDLAFAALRRGLNGEERVVAPFRGAWTLMYGAISRLDALQDGDPIEQPLPDAPGHGAQYNLVFGAYALAVALLDDLPESVAPWRAARLRRLWSDSVLRMADGQQRDLAAGREEAPTATLDAYQQIAQAKTGATYALAFAGVGALLSDDEALIGALAGAGEIYGTLVQYRDDLLDSATQPNPALTLPLMLERLPLGVEGEPERVALAFWSYICPRYRRRAADLLAGRGDLAAAVDELFQLVFERPAAGARP